jgi:methyl acetate hydrolase
MTDPFAAALDAANLAGAVTLTGTSASTGSVQTFGKRDLASGAPMEADTLFQIASMTKAITSTAALQCVERGQLSLDAPLGDVLPELDALQVFNGFGEDGHARFRPAKRRITLRHLLTHTAGLGYLFSNAELAGLYSEETAPKPGTLDSIRLPLLFDPGERWEYGVSTDWVGLAVEAVTGQTLDAYVTEAVTGPLGMADTSFFPSDAQRGRCATLYARDPEAGLLPMNFEIGGGRKAELVSGGGGLWSTAGDYARFLRMIMNKGTLDGTRILAPESVAMMTSNQIGVLGAGKMAAVMPQLALAYDQFPGMTCGWSLSFLINPEPGPDGRAAGSLAWAGIANCYYWIDPQNDMFGIFLTQLLPFADPRTLEAFAAFERNSYSGRA